MQDQIFVARELELQQLQKFLNLMLSGTGQVCFVTGEAGSGKSMLVREFIHRSQDMHPDLIAATGMCNAQTGIGDPYLPFREILALLVGNSESELIRNEISTKNAKRLRELGGWFGETLLEFGPDLAGLFIPGASIAARVLKVGATRAGWLEKLTKPQEKRASIQKIELSQDAVYDQYATTLREFTKRHPLIIVLDDLQWADNASIGLLFHLTRQIKENKLFIIGTYRPNDLAVGRGEKGHPLQSPLHEIKREFGEVWIDLDETRRRDGRTFIDALVDTEHNQLGEAFRQALFDRTKGNALFAIEILRTLQERGELTRDKDGYWVMHPSLDWDELPARVEGVIEERVRRLDESLRAMLDVACVEGQEFTAQVISCLQQKSELQVLQGLSRKIEKQHRLIQETHEMRVGQSTLSHFQFSHALFQQYLYEDLSNAVRRLLHEQVGLALESLYGEYAYRIAPSLAKHFDQGKQVQKAINYLSMAGEQALLISALPEAYHLLERAVVLTRSISETDLSSRQQVLTRLLYHLGVTMWFLGEYSLARTYLEESFVLARADDDRLSMAAALSRLGRVLDDQGEFEAAIKILQEGELYARQVEEQTVLSLVLRNLGNVELDIGRYDSARLYYEESLSLAKECGDGDGQSAALNNLGLISMHTTKNYEEAKKFFEQALCIDRELGSRAGVTTMVSNLGMVSRRLGRFEEARRYHEEELLITREIGSQGGECYALTGLGALARDEGNYIQARRYLYDALALGFKIGFRYQVLDTLHNIGGLLERLGRSKQAIAVLGFVLQQPSTEDWVRQEAQSLYERLIQQLPSEIVSEAWKQSQSMSLEVVVHKVLSWLSET